MALAAALVVLPAPASALADFGIQPDPDNPALPDFHADLFNEDGSVDSRAGGHPFAATTDFTLSTTLDPLGSGNPVPDQNLKDAVVDLPVGFVGNPQAAPTCSGSDLINGECPVDSQIGTTTFRLMKDPGGFLWPQEWTTAVYNMEPNRDELAAFGFLALGTVPVRLVASVRTEGDFGVRMTVPNISQTLALTLSKLSIWGVPADPRHQAERGLLHGCLALRAVPGGICTSSGGNYPSSVAPKPFLTAPVDCAHGRFTTTMRIASWQHPDVWKSYDALSQTGVTGCDRLVWNPTLELRPTSSQAGAPTGLDVELRVPQNDNPNALGSPHLDKAVVRLPEGMRVSPSAADGLAGCSDAQIAMRSNAEPACPGGSNIGTVSIDTPLLEEPLTGNVFVGTQTPDQLLRLFLVVRGRGDLLIKIAGKVDPDPVTGRLTATFDDNPQLPFETLSMHLKGGSRATVVNPPTCGTHTTRAELTSWSSPVAAISQSSFQVSGDCARSGRFEPSLVAGTASPTAGAFSPLSVMVARPDGQQALQTIETTMPEGLLAKLAGVPLCPDAQAATGTCAEGSRVGRVEASAGPGSTPVWLPQAGKAPTAVYLAGPYKGAPYSLSVVVPAQAGPFDLGTVVVRVALFVDPVDAHVTAKADPMPHILEGIPLDVREVRVLLDRERFTLNPTSCKEKRIGGLIGSVQGARAEVASRFQVGDCGALAFKPRLGLRLTGRKQVRTGRHPGVRAIVRQRGIGEAGIDGARVTLPKSLALDPENAQALCEFADGTKPDLENHCPKGSIVGRARAKTPLLDKDLVGDVYFVKNVRISKKTGNEIRTLPMIVVALRGEIAINLTGKSSTTKSGRLVNTFANVPDAPIGRFNLNINGGRNGILAVTGTRRGNINLCAKPKSHIANTAWRGQNGKRASYGKRVKTPCAKKKRGNKAAKKDSKAKRRGQAKSRKP